MKKFFSLILAAAIFVSFSACKKDNAAQSTDSSDVLSSPAPSAENKTDSANESDLQADSDIFVLKNNCQDDLYSIEFTEAGKEPLALNGVLPAGNEVSVKKDGSCVISAKILNSDNTYKSITFGQADLSSHKTVTLCGSGTHFFISYE